ncbi:tyrosine protein kinase, putative [Entamoeba invadens IP1]|uniref:tyrosine protein kinase, putative n=1 Tax=Entamoeba invadens IP1 TaxID=370355 RepID=UPI0002C3FB35|nr:tyrosine protein kinase, putative [Entamoeba invadens IP1]ELP85159.1 tyrosine protein kinase, putative [Entamoeba invadens IP1]|eukprot:XP_004184505.1 tyrosine protein kinase, putative [Entamoeba invadens IP1]
MPSIVTLKKGEACEFEIFNKLLCSFICLNLTTGEQNNHKLQVVVCTANSTKLNYKELEEIKLICEGSFGMVYKGTFRGKEVATKKMKQIQKMNQLLNDFENEVNMLDKFRSEYIIHFYGACFIPNHICMVTEFALYGSLQDLMKHKKSDEISSKIKMKIIIDASKRILHLHENHILHRDIKPDNILVISLENGMNVNGKLTDFGSSRNINLLTTNMTFTKGIGSPKYMAQEILNKQHYKKAADVYSLAVTLFETLIWGEAYTGDEFKFPWSIANFVASGKRLSVREGISPEAYRVISEMWTHKPENRPTADVVVILLQKLQRIN